MHIFRFHCPQGFRLGFEINGGCFDLGAAGKQFAGISAWLALADPLEAIREILPSIRNFPLIGEAKLVAPIDDQEVWASGVTYLRSKIARMEESEKGGDFYDRVYEAERPELFFKSMPHRVAGNGQPIRIRRDSACTVPEPELVLVLS